MVLVLASHQTDTELMNEILTLLMSSYEDIRDFCDQLREVVELDQVVQHYRAITIISNVYKWLG